MDNVSNTLNAILNNAEQNKQAIIDKLNASLSTLTPKDKNNIIDVDKISDVKKNIEDYKKAQENLQRLKARKAIIDAQGTNNNASTNTVSSGVSDSV